ncbi:hypothetical protein AKJ38_01975 [candidate division MSBL1 archaeon SCGC-AAA259I14]|uniref:Steroid 5-alpha reductase C-terminal domain-containing protein n=1 Tax=candidate division MSBL1 archaeon SCGC-AAA259I14 TaxID=1698268 RepID=A0A133USC0_9EURY|nr:hypothetical protein AKJ38_01975 [candidate division MSBL1 archaeon SCGC-AAA259I14]
MELESLGKVKDWLFKHISSAVAPLLLLFQSIPVVGFMGLMLFPIATYLFSLFWKMPSASKFEILTLFLSKRLILGRIIALSGFIIFLVGLVSLIRGRGKIVKTKFYSLVRHPQYLGFIIMTWGISIMSLQHVRVAGWYVRWGWGYLPLPIGWLLMALSYVLLACWEEWYLTKKHSREYQEYRQKVPFMFPLPYSPKIPEPLSTLVIVLIFAFSLILF